MGRKPKHGVPYRGERGSSEYTRDRNLRTNHNITLDEYERILAAQNGVCAICGDARQEGKYRMHVDHDHACCEGDKGCGKCIRGILCVGCNTGIGLFRDDKTRLAKAIVYLEKFS